MEATWESGIDLFSSIDREENDREKRYQSWKGPKTDTVVVGFMQMRWCWFALLGSEEMEQIEL